MDGLRKRNEAAASPGTREITLIKIISDSSLPVEVDRDSAGALRTHLDDTRFLRLDDNGRKRSSALQLSQQDTDSIRTAAGLRVADDNADDAA